MKNKIAIIISIICLAIIIVFGMYLVDKIRMQNNKSVLFSNWGYSYVPSINLPEEEIKTAIMKFIVNKGDKQRHYENSKTFASMRIFLIEEKEKYKLYNIYAWVLEEQFYLEDNELKQDSGSSIPYKFIVQNIDNKFEVIDSIIPRDRKLLFRRYEKNLFI